MIICDTRERKNEHILKWFDRHGIPYITATVHTGDYVISDRNDIAVERKMSCSELSHNLLSHDKGRFYREIRRAHEAGIKLYVVCEHGHGIESIQDVAKWENPYGRVSGKMLREAIYKCAIGYGCEFIFCNKRQTGKVICEILTKGEYKHEHGSGTASGKQRTVSVQSSGVHGT